MRAIFISYRRDDSAGEAGRLFDDLTAQFGPDKVFMDVAAVEPGRDFRKVIDQNVASCGVVLAIIGKGWADAKDDAGRRRLDDPLDFVRLETASALKRDIPVIPVLVQGGRMPRAEQLPKDLTDLAYRNGVELTHSRWGSDVELLIKALRSHLGNAEKESGSVKIEPVPREASVGGGTVLTKQTSMATSREKPTILIVDDTPANLSLLSDVLKSDYRTKAAVNGEKALKLAFSGTPPDLILLDIMMPGMDGYDVCRRLKENPATRSIPVIFVTAMSEVEDETKGLELGGVDYVTKPISAPIVKARVKTQLALYEQAREMERMIVKLQAQAGELAEWNRTLEQRVAEGVNQLDRLGRLKRFFSPAVVELLLSGSAEDPLKTHRNEIAAMFLDLRGFTTFTETSAPEDVMGVIGEYHEAMGELVMAHSGTVERFAGDGIMIFFNDPVQVDNPAGKAVKMAIAMQQRFATLAQGWHKRGYDIAMGIGVAQGYATIGAIGFEGRRDYGAIGTVTNLAARLCGEAAGGQILISQRVQGLVADFAKTDPIGELSLKGFHRPVMAYAVHGYIDGPGRTPT